MKVEYVCDATVDIFKERWEAVKSFQRGVTVK